MMLFKIAQKVTNVYGALSKANSVAKNVQKSANLVTLSKAALRSFDSLILFLHKTRRRPSCRLEQRRPNSRGEKTNPKAGFFLFFKKWANLGLFFIYFRSFQKKHYFQFLQQIYVKKCPSSIRSRDLNPQPLEHEPLPLTTRAPALTYYN